MANCIVVTHDGTVTRREITSLADMQAAVGGFVELVHETDTYCFWCNEEGIGEDLPINQKAGRWIKAELAKMNRRLLTADGWLLGDVFISGPHNDAGELTDAPVGLEEILAVA